MSHTQTRSLFAVLALVVASVALPVLPALAANKIYISEIAYADNTGDFIEIAAPAGTKLDGWKVGSVTRGGTVQDATNVRTLANTIVGDSGAVTVDISITNTVKSGAQTDGAYGASAFLISPDGKIVSFNTIGGNAGKPGVEAGSSAHTPEVLAGNRATSTGATAGKGKSIALINGKWVAGAPTPGTLPEGAGDPNPSEPTPEPTPEPTDEPTTKPTDEPTKEPSPKPTNEPTAEPTPEPTDDPADPAEPGDVTPIRDIQGTSDKSPMVGKSVTTRGIVTATYPTGGLNGYYIQTPGTGGAEHDLGGPSDGLFVYSSDTVKDVKRGDFVQVNGQVSEFYGLTQISVKAGGMKQLKEAAPEVKPYEGEIPTGDENRESLEGMLVQPTGDITVTDNYSTNKFGEVALVNGKKALYQPTDKFRPGSKEATDLAKRNSERSYLLDDGSTLNFLTKGQGTPVSYLDNEQPVRVGAKVTFTSAAVFSYGHEAWRLQPVGALTDAEAGVDEPAKFGNDRHGSPEMQGGKLASFNVLNFFPTTGDQLKGCSYYKDREGNPVTVNGGCDARGAANLESLSRQQIKILNAINQMDVAVLSLEELENSEKFGKNRDFAINHLVRQLNKQAGYGKWAAVTSPKSVPATGDDVIRTGFIYQPTLADTEGASEILDNPAFSNARAPLAQKFVMKKDGKATGESFVAVVNHFKSKGSGKGPGNEDSGDGQGNSNADRVKQAKALVTFADAMKKKAKTNNVFLLGDFNSYTQEDPMQEFYKAGYVDAGEKFEAEPTYVFGGQLGSLDHVLANDAAAKGLKGAYTWTINSRESVALEYSRYNYNVTNFYDPSPFRSSDHDPTIVDFDLK